MAIKDLLHPFKPVLLCTILVLMLIFFAVEIIISHFTHSLTLLTDAYHLLCNIMALGGFIASVKYKEPFSTKSKENLMRKENEQEARLCLDEVKSEISAKAKQKENSLRNTFGWARVDVLLMLICCVFLASFCFSVIVEALQTLIHIEHHDEMHHPTLIFFIGINGLFLNIISHLVIKGQTQNVIRNAYLNEDGVISTSVSTGNNSNKSSSTLKNVKFGKLLKDTIGCIIVVICAILCYLMEEERGKFIDPLLSIVSATALICLSYPYMRESCFILLQTIPNTIDIQVLRSKLLQHFPQIVSIHDLHVWELTTNRIILTAHIIFYDQEIYETTTKQVKDFFLSHGITQVTLQPEFHNKSSSTESIVSAKSGCLFQCQSVKCKTSCCCINDVEEI